MGPDKQLCVAFTFIPHNIWKKTLIYRKVYNILFEDRHKKANDNLFATNCNWLQLTTLHLKKKIDKLDREKSTSLSLE